ncbi:861_t:CDS:2 [Paraglomus occultum]|uniref:861_t:CDS:1 n=1 Tax=Paraglomus occultum TaxID=144539 RepID=A0A9N8ZI36_9GLOM|nr:861_t:CDS:2 [Paraglomus occultum]
MNITTGPSIKNKRKNIFNSISGSKKSRSITRKTLTGLQKKLCEMFNTRLYQNQKLAEKISISPATDNMVENAVNNNQSVSGHIILEKAREFATRLGVHNFNGSNGWLEKFKN